MAVATDRANGGRLRTVLAVALSLLLAALVAFGVLLFLRVTDSEGEGDARSAALAAARLQAVNLTTIDYRDTDMAVQRILAGATGTLETQFKEQRSQLGPLLTGTKSTSRGSVLEAGLVKLDGRTATALVAVDATVSTQPTGTTKAQTSVKHYRMSMNLQRIGSRWLVSDVGFTGLAQ